MDILASSVPTKEHAIATRENAFASRITMERLVNVPCAPMIALDVVSV